MDRSPPPFFNQGPSAHARLIFFSLLAIVLLVVDARMGTLQALREGIGTALYPLQRVLLVPRDVFNFGLEYVGEVNRLRGENAELRRLEVSNAKMLLESEHLASENARLRELFGARQRLSVRTVISEVLYDNRDPFARRQTLDKGLRDGVQPGQPVVDARGVIGQITRVFPFSSELTLLTDRTSTIPVEIQRTGLRSVAFGMGPGSMELRYLSSGADVRGGDLLVTSGLDGIYPPGLPVARVRPGTDRAGQVNASRMMLDPVGGVDQARLVLILLIDQSANPPPVPPPESDASAPARKGRGGPR